MNDQVAIDRITETENLTDALEDSDADWLIQWGIGHVHSLLQGASTDEIAGNRINALMAVMRKLNQIAADRQVKNADTLAADVRELVERFQHTFPDTHKLTSAQIAQAAATIRGKSPREAMQHLIDLLNPSGKPSEKTP